MTKSEKTGFTLAELLLALVILGVIATFTIPKVLNTQGDSKRIAVFKETIATLSDINYTGMQSGELQQDNQTVYFKDHLNYIKHCPGDSNAQGCYTPDPAKTGLSDEPGFLLANGAAIAGFDNVAGNNRNHVVVDWNGSTGPNLLGQDQVALRMVFGVSAGDRAGTVVANPSEPLAITLYEEIFAND